VRLILAFAAALVLMAVSAIFGFQQSEISHLRAALAEYDAPRAADAPAPAPAVHRSGNGSATGLTADDRRFILNQYQDVLASLNLPPGRAARLQDLLTRRIEVALNAQDAASRAGVAPDSPEMLRAEGSAIAGVDRDIATLLGPTDDQHFIWMTSGAPPAPAVAAAAPAPAPVVVNVVMASPPAEAAYPAEPAYSDQTEAPAYSDAYAPSPAPYYYYAYPFATVVAERRFPRSFEGERPRFGGVTSFRPPAFNGGGEVSAPRPSRRAR
jgi:hypothetical protein